MMNISGVGNTGIDYTRNSARQLEQEAAQQESIEQQEEQTATIQQSGRAFSASSQEAQTAKSSVSTLSGQVAESLESNSEWEDSSDQSLISKANAGSTLTKSELSRLKEIDPGLYSQTLKAENARGELRQQMARNPSGASRAAHAALAQNSESDLELTRKALTEEYQNFASKYDQAMFGTIQ